MKKIPTLLCFALLAIVGLSGCKNESDRAHDEVGETRVFDEAPRRVAHRAASFESVPAPLQMQQGQRVAQKRFQMIGEMDME